MLFVIFGPDPTGAAVRAVSARINLSFVAADWRSSIAPGSQITSPLWPSPRYTERPARAGSCGYALGSVQTAPMMPVEMVSGI
jgi:hypothetical protein